MEVVTTRTIALLTTDVKTKIYCRQQRDENITAKMLARRSNAMWDILLAAGEAGKALAGNILTTKSIRLQTEYMDTRKTRIILHGLLTYITEDHMGVYFLLYGLVNEVSTVKKKKSGLATSLTLLVVTLTRKNFKDVPNALKCGGRNIYVVV